MYFALLLSSSFSPIIQSEYKFISTQLLSIGFAHKHLLEVKKRKITVQMLVSTEFDRTFVETL